MNLRTLVRELREYPGITRKHKILAVMNFIPNVGHNKILASYGEDAAVIDYDDSALLLAADGIMESLMKAHPYYAGYFSVLVNINDIAAMGGLPMAMVNIISMKEEKVCSRVMKGVETAVNKFNVPMVGGHTHPDCQYDAIDVAILGRTEKESVIYSHTAKDGDDIIFAIDLDGFFPDALTYAWDTTTRKSAEEVGKRVTVMNEIGKEDLVNSGKDMSNPGSLGTLGMLLETSGKGGVVEIEKIPKPDDYDQIQWLRAYQGCGFVVTCDLKNSPRTIEMFEEVDITAEVVGKVDDSSELILEYQGERETLFDFNVDIITGCKPDILKRKNYRFDS